MYLKYSNLPLTSSYDELSKSEVFNKLDYKTKIYQKALLNETLFWRLCVKAFTYLYKLEKVPAFLCYKLANHKKK